MSLFVGSAQSRMRSQFSPGDLLTWGSWTVEGRRDSNACMLVSGADTAWVTVLTLSGRLRTVYGPDLELIQEVASV